MLQITRLHGLLYKRQKASVGPFCWRPAHAEETTSIKFLESAATPLDIWQIPGEVFVTLLTSLRKRY